jgi:hypothetical protein
MIGSTADSRPAVKILRADGQQSKRDVVLSNQTNQGGASF